MNKSQPRKSRLEELHERLDRNRQYLAAELGSVKPSERYVKDLTSTIENITKQISMLQRTGGLGYEFVNGAKVN